MNKNNIGMVIAFSIFIAVFFRYSAHSQTPNLTQYQSGLLAELYVNKIDAVSELNSIPSNTLDQESTSGTVVMTEPSLVITVPIAMGVPPFTGRGLDSRLVLDMASNAEISPENFSGLKWDGFIRSMNLGEYTYQVIASGLPRSATCTTTMAIDDKKQGPVKISTRTTKALEISLSHDKGMIPFSLYLNCNTSIVSSSVSLELQRKDASSRSFKQIGADEFFHVAR